MRAGKSMTQVNLLPPFKHPIKESRLKGLDKKSSTG
jgi:hypothetical protein